MNCRSVTGNLLACGVVAAMIAPGCGGAVQEEGPGAVLHQPELPTMPKGPMVEVPEATAREMKACVDAAGHRWTEPSYAFQYDMKATDRGDVVGVKLHDATLRDASLEACFERTLAAMSVPKDALLSRSSKPISGGESTYSSRAPAGFVQALAAPIALAPIIIPALGVTIIVAISLDIIRKLTAEQERCKQVLEFCIAKCTEEAIPSGSPSGDPFFKCRKECLDAANCWGVSLY